MAVGFAYGPPEFVIGFFVFLIIITVVIWAIRSRRNKEDPPYYYDNAAPQRNEQPTSDRPSQGRSYNGDTMRDSYSGGNYDKERYDSSGKRII